MTATTNEELKKAAQDALAVQDACNLCGVVHSFARAMSAVRESVNSTDEANRHPIAILFADKIADMTGINHYLSTHYNKAYEEVEQIVKNG